MEKKPRLWNGVALAITCVPIPSYAPMQKLIISTKTSLPLREVSLTRTDRECWTFGKWRGRRNPYLNRGYDRCEQLFRGRYWVTFIIVCRLKEFLSLFVTRPQILSFSVTILRIYFSRIRWDIVFALTNKWPSNMFADSLSSRRWKVVPSPPTSRS